MDPKGLSWAIPQSDLGQLMDIHSRQNYGLQAWFPATACCFLPLSLPLVFVCLSLLSKVNVTFYTQCMIANGLNQKDQV